MRQEVNYPAQPDAVKQESQVENQLRSLDAAIERAGKGVEQLSARLVSVSRVEPPSPIGKDKLCPVQTLCPVAETLRASSERVDNLMERVNRMRDLLEI